MVKPAKDNQVSMQRNKKTKARIKRRTFSIAHNDYVVIASVNFYGERIITFWHFVQVQTQTEKRGMKKCFDSKRMAVSISVVRVWIIIRVKK